MPLTVSSLSDLSQSKVTLQQQIALQLLQEYVPDISFRRGVMHDLVLHLSAVLGAVNQENILRLYRSNSLYAINRDPTLADDAVVTRALSNWGVVRREGTKASGTFSIVLSQRVSVVVPVGTELTVAGVSFLTTEAVVARISEEDVIASTDRLLTDNGNGTWAFLVTAEAAEIGTAGNVKYGAAAVMTNPIAKYSSAAVYADFSGGADAETNEELLARLPSGISFKGNAGRANLDALVKDQFPETRTTSAIGFGDAEMLRDQHSLWPGSIGGRCDLYVRTLGDWLTETVDVTATLLTKSGAFSTWQFNLTMAEAAGVYEVQKILLDGQAVTASGFTPTTDTRGYDVTDDGSGLVPDIANATEAAYSPRQTIQIVFTDETTNTSSMTVGDTRDCRAVIRRMPYVAEIQALLQTRSVAAPWGDILVKAAVPCFVSASMTVHFPAGADLPEGSDIAAVVAEYVDNLGFVPRLSSSQIAKKIYDAYPEATVSDIMLIGRIRKPSGTEHILNSADALVLPDLPDDLTTWRTTAFLLPATGVSVTVIPLE